MARVRLPWKHGLDGGDIPRGSQRRHRKNKQIKIKWRNTEGSDIINYLLFK